MTTESITPKQLEILILLYRFRFLNRIHIQKSLNHKNHSRITPWLKDLTDRHIINRIYSKTWDSLHTPAIYYLAYKSLPILKQQKNCNQDVFKRVYREGYRSETFIVHCLFIADLYFHFQATTQRLEAEYHFLTATDMTSFSYTPEPLPDAYIAIKEKKRMKRYFLTIFDEKIPMYAIRKRILQYNDYYQENYWQDYHKKPFPKILLICPTQRVKKSLLRFIPAKLYEDDLDMSFYLALKEDIQNKGIQADTWEAAV